MIVSAVVGTIVNLTLLFVIAGLAFIIVLKEASVTWLSTNVSVLIASGIATPSAYNCIDVRPAVPLNEASSDIA